MEVVVPSPSPPGSPTMDPFDFNAVSPYLSAPSSPKRFGEYYLSAPTSPSRLTDFYSDFDHYNAADSDGGFAFFVGGGAEKASRSAEELFDGGKIKPLREDELFESARSPLLSPAHQQAQPKRSPIVSQGKKAIKDAFSPRRKKDSSNDSSAPAAGEGRRGRDRTPAAATSSSSRRVTRSHSPYRMTHYTWEEEQQQEQGSKEDPMRGAKSSSRKWRLRDLLLFRSASEGRGSTSSKDPFRKADQGSSFRSSENPPKSRRKEPLSAHYARKKAESEDLKKRTFLPYKQGILGRLAGFGI